MPDKKNEKARPMNFQQPSQPTVPTADVPRLTAEQEWQRREAIPALPPSKEDVETMRRMSRRSFLWYGATVAGAFGGLYAFNKYAPEKDGTKTALRRVLTFNEAVAKAIFFSPTHRAQEFDLSQATTPHNNYKGATPEIDIPSWTLTLEGERGRTEARTLTIDDIKKLPEVSQTTELKCIEGWSNVVNWSGVRFYDFIRKYPPPPDTRYVALFSEPEGFEDERYYVGLDIESALHPQALLAYAMNGKVLDSDHGAPLRLAIPHKYGIKNIKLITRIAYTNVRPADYWAELGYDWYAGL